MSRFSRINAIWRKELVDTLRDRRTLVAMVLVPMVLYPALMLGSMQALEVQVSSLVTERYDVGVENDQVRAWLQALIDSDAARRGAPASAPAEEVLQHAASAPASRPAAPSGGPRSRAREGAYENPPPLRVIVVDIGDVVQAVLAGKVHVGLRLDGAPPTPATPGCTTGVIAYDESEIRSGIASQGVRGVLDRAGNFMLARRLAERALSPEFVTPIDIKPLNVATAERMAGSTLGTIVPLILIMMTITGAIYPAIDLTAGERERGTLETLMAAPVPTIELIAGKFIVVTLIGMLSAVLNLLSIGGTIYLGGVGSVLTQGRELIFPISALPWVLLMLLPLAVLFSAVLLAVCSFARSFKEAQNYIVPVMMAAMIPGIVGILPGTRLAGPIIIMPVANIVVLTRELFLGKFDYGAILWVVLSTTMYAGAAVAVAARLFGQEAVLFVDSGSVKTVFQRRFFKPRPVPTAATALLLLTITYSLNFYIQNSLGQSLLDEHGRLGAGYLLAVAMTLVVLLAAAPLATSIYLKLDPLHSLALRPPPVRGLISGALLGASTWVLAPHWLAFQAHYFPMGAEMERALLEQSGFMQSLTLPMLLACIAIVPAVCEELFFRGFVLAGVRSAMGKATAVTIVAIAFGLFHYSAHRMALTTALGVLLGVLAVQYRSVWPCIVAHVMHNGMSVLASRDDGLKPLLEGAGFREGLSPPLLAALAGGAVLAGIGLAIGERAYGRKQGVTRQA